MNTVATNVAIASMAYLLLEEEEEEEAWYAAHAKRPRKQRSQWVREMFAENSGFYSTLCVRENDPVLYTNFLRMSAEDFDLLLQKDAPQIEKQNTNMRESICAGQRLAITLRFLASGDNYMSLMYLF